MTGSQVYCFPSWQLHTALNCHYFTHVLLLKDGCDSIICQGLIYRQNVTLQVWMHEYGLLIMLNDSTMRIPNIVSLNAAILRVIIVKSRHHSPDIYFPVEWDGIPIMPQCETSWVTVIDWFMKTCAGIFQLNFLAYYLENIHILTVTEVHTTLGSDKQKKSDILNVWQHEVNFILQYCYF